MLAALGLSHNRIFPVLLLQISSETETETETDSQASVRNFSQNVVVGDRWLLVRCHRMSCVTLLRSPFLLLHVASREGNRVDVFGELHLKNDHSSIAELHL